jgi:hypothetical protein
MAGVAAGTWAASQCGPRWHLKRPELVPGAVLGDQALTMYRAKLAPESGSGAVFDAPEVVIA